MQTDCRVGENHALLNENERTLTAAVLQLRVERVCIVNPAPTPISHR